MSPSLFVTTYPLLLSNISPESSFVTVCVVVVVVVVVVVTISVPKSSSVTSTCTSSVIVTPGVQRPSVSGKQSALE
jgi:hypothetical protein